MRDISAHFPLGDCLKPPVLTISDQAAADFEALFQGARATGPSAQIVYRLIYPKYLFLHYLAQTHGLMLHGSPVHGLAILNPERQTHDVREFADQAAVYATQDPLWSMFFAVLDKSKVKTGISNAAIHLLHDDGAYLRFYYFTVDEPSLRQHPWGPGAVYIMPATGFEADPDQLGAKVGPYTMQVTHWIHRGAITPLAWLPLEPEDFPFIDQIWGYDVDEFDRRMSADSVAGFPFLSDRTVYPINPLYT
jgi:hypothetical protein